MTSGPVYDFSFAHGSLRPQQFVDVGAGGVIGYVGGDSRKCITRGEVDGYHEAGLAVATVHERTASWTSWDGGAANRDCDALGQPADRPIYFASDEDVSPAAYPQISARLASEPGPRPKGIYGESGLVEFCIDDGSAVVGWITSASSWSHDPAPKAALRQLVGQTTIPGTDKNIVLLDDWGQWPLETSENPVPEITLVTPPAVYEATFLDGTPNPRAGKPHPLAGGVFATIGLFANHVSSPGMMNLYKYLGAGGPVAIHSEWFDNLTLLPSTADLVNHSFPKPSAGGGGGSVDVGAVAAAAAKATLDGLAGRLQQ